MFQEFKRGMLSYALCYYIANRGKSPILLNLLVMAEKIRNIKY